KRHNRPFLPTSRNSFLPGISVIHIGSTNVRFGNAFSVLHPVACSGGEAGKTPLKYGATGCGASRPPTWAATCGIAVLRRREASAVRQPRVNPETLRSVESAFLIVCPLCSFERFTGSPIPTLRMTYGGLSTPHDFGSLQRSALMVLERLRLSGTCFG